MQVARSSNALPSAGVHQSRRLPSASNWRPWSSKPCVSSWPIDRAGRAEVDRVVDRLVEERRLQNAGREVDLVLERVVVRVDRRRRHPPFGPVDRLADLRQLRGGLECVGALRVAERVAARRSSASSSRATCPGSRPCSRPQRASPAACSCVSSRHPGERLDVAAERASIATTIFERARLAFAVRTYGRT